MKIPATQPWHYPALTTNIQRMSGCIERQEVPCAACQLSAGTRIRVYTEDDGGTGKAVVMAMCRTCANVKDQYEHTKFMALNSDTSSCPLGLFSFPPE